MKTGWSTRNGSEWFYKETDSAIAVKLFRKNWHWCITVNGVSGWTTFPAGTTLDEAKAAALAAWRMT